MNILVRFYKILLLCYESFILFIGVWFIQKEPLQFDNHKLENDMITQSLLQLLAICIDAGLKRSENLAFLKREQALLAYRIKKRTQ